MKNEKIFWVAILCLSISAGFWLMIFHQFPLSDKTDDWSNFGSYIGGVTGPLLSFISIILVLRTISLTQKNHEEQIKLISQEQIYTKFNDLCEYLESVIKKSWLNEEDSYFNEIIEQIKEEVIFDSRFIEGNSNHNYAITIEKAVGILARERRDIDEIALVIDSILRNILSYNPSDSRLMKNILELKLTKKQRFLIFFKLRSDHPEIAALLYNHWPGFAMPIF
ncbi:hypothetical protein ACK1L0_004376 [Salmonella enterica]|nr:hypothetical protein [Salmonella enterica]